MPTYGSWIIDAAGGANQSQTWVTVPVHGANADSLSSNMSFYKQTLTGGGTQFIRIEATFDEDLTNGNTIGIFPGSVDSAVTALNIHARAVRFRLNGTSGSSTVAVGMLLL